MSSVLGLYWRAGIVGNVDENAGFELDIDDSGHRNADDGETNEWRQDPEDDLEDVPPRLPVNPRPRIVDLLVPPVHLGRPDDRICRTISTAWVSRLGVEASLEE